MTTGNDHYLAIHTWIPIEDAYLRALAEATDGDTFVEVGVWQGRSVCFLGEMARRRGVAIRIVAVDTFDPGSPLAVEHGLTDPLNAFLDNVFRQDLESVVDAIVAESTEGATWIDPGSAFVVMIDADHAETAVQADLAAWFPAVRPGGWLMGHDWEFDGVRAAVTEFAAARGLAIVLSADRTPCWMIRVPARGTLGDPPTCGNPQTGERRGESA